MCAGRIQCLQASSTSHNSPFPRFVFHTQSCVGMEIATLRNLGRDVLFQFGAASLALRKNVSEQLETDDEIKHFIENLTTESERFQLWAANIGLQATGDRSLDYRVKDSSSVKLYASQLLEELAEDLLDRNSHSYLWEQEVLTSFSLQTFCCAIGSHEYATVAK
jgi:hypothetical protein